MQKYYILATLVSLATAQYFYPLPEPDSPESGEYIELVRIPRALQNRPSLVPQGPLPPRVGAPGGIPLPQLSLNQHANRRVAPPMYDPYMTSASSHKKEPLATAESHGHGHHHGHDYVDYGAYTGGWGAFGWYSDHPVHSHGY